MRPDRGLEEACDPRPERTRERRDDDREEDVRERVQAVEGRPDPHGEDAADDVLALTADVEHAAAEREGNRETREDQRRHDQERLLEVEARVEPLVARDPGEEPVEACAVRRSRDRS